jgi:hypothetical protein
MLQHICRRIHQFCSPFLDRGMFVADSFDYISTGTGFVILSATMNSSESLVIMIIVKCKLSRKVSDWRTTRFRRDAGD